MSRCAEFRLGTEPGRRFLGGARAQEEELCRCSGLYRALLAQPDYDEAHREGRSLLYSDRLIYTPSVPFFRLATKEPFLEEPFTASIITAPAPNAGAIARNRPAEAKFLEATFERRWRNVLAVAAERGHRVAVLGAWGCGAFRNDPSMVAGVARRVFDERVASPLERIVFAIPDRGSFGRRNHAAFRAAFAV